jgi:glycosyltransferase involved in cell wall biosynthesis
MANAHYFSIVVPTYNRASYISKTLQSVLDQTFADFEVLVIDDGSTDNTEDVVLSLADERIRYYKKENGERGSARNYGVCLAHGYYVTFLDSDDFFRVSHLEEAKNYIERNPRTEIFHLGYDVVTPEGKIIYRWQKLPDPVNLKLVEGNFLSCLGIFARRQILVQTPFNEDRELSGSEDYELWVRLASKYSIRTHAISTACLVNHETRSVLQIDPIKFSRRIFLFKEYLTKNEDVVSVYGPYFNKIFAFKDLYAALHLSISNNKSLGIKSLWLSMRKYPGIMLNFRFWVVVKKLILN